MAKQSKQQKETVGRVMHEFKHGELNRGRGGEVKNPKQAIAIALHEAGASRNESPDKNKQNLRKTKAKERRSETSQQEAEGRKRAKAPGGSGTEQTRADLYAEAKRRNIPGRSKMSKDQLAQALR